MIKIEKVPYSDTSGKIAYKSIRDVAKEYFTMLNPVKNDKDNTHNPQKIGGVDYQGANAVIAILKIKIDELEKSKKFPDLLTLLKYFYGNSNHLDNLENFILASPKDLQAIHIPKIKAISKNIVWGTKSQPTPEKEIVNNIFYYDTNKFTEKRKWLGETLNTKVCPYCNNQFILNISNDKNNKINLFEIDHFYSQSDFPYLALCFYNLVPICMVCNGFQSKSGENTFDKPLIHPYEDSFHKKVKFKTTDKTDEDTIRQLLEKGSFEDKLINIELVERINDGTKKLLGNHEKFFHLTEIYKQHTDIVSEIYAKAYIYNESRRDELIHFFKNDGFSNEEIVRFILGNYANEEDFNLRPHSKLTYDIADEMKLLRHLPLEPRKPKVIPPTPRVKPDKKWHQKLMQFFADSLKKMACWFEKYA